MSFEGQFDVVIEGAGTFRGARVVSAADGLYIDDHEIPYGTVLGVALRGSILLVVGTQVAAALRGAKEGLATLAADLRGHADLGHLAAQEREALEEERIVFSTPVAVSGAVDLEKRKGLSLAVVSDEHLHLLERGGHRIQVSWSTVTSLDTREAKFGRILKLKADSANLELLYLTDAQIQTIRGLAGRRAGRPTPPPVTRRTPPEPPSKPARPRREEPRETEPTPAEREAARSGRPGSATRPTEEEPAARARPTRREPGPKPEQRKPAASRGAAPLPDTGDPSRHFQIPEFELALGSVGSGSDRPLRAAIERLQVSPVMPAGFLDEHLRELRSLYNSALVKRKRAAAAADDLAGAADSLDGEELWNDLLERVAVVADGVLRAFERQARRLAVDRRIPWRRARKKYVPDDREVAAIRQRLTRGLGPMQPMLFRVSEAAQAVRDASDGARERIREAYEEWLETLRELDAAYAAGWDGLGREIVGVWSEALLPRLHGLAGERRRLLPWSFRLGLYIALLVLALVIGYLYLTGRLGTLPFLG